MSGHKPWKTVRTEPSAEAKGALQALQHERTKVTSECPNCGDVAERETYDIGDGPELSCASCEWCWGANDQALTPMTYSRVVEDLGYDPMDKLREQRETGNCSGE